MLEELLQEIEELKTYKKKYEYALKDKQRMSDLLFELMTEKYNRTSFAERRSNYRKSTCSACRYQEYCDLEIPNNIQEPIKSDEAWIPGTKTCGNFEWS